MSELHERTDEEPFEADNEDLLQVRNLMQHLLQALPHSRSNRPRVELPAQEVQQRVVRSGTEQAFFRWRVQPHRALPHQRKRDDGLQQEVQEGRQVCLHAQEEQRE